MKNPRIALVLKSYRKKRNLSVEQVFRALEKSGYKLSKKTIYAWESGATQPDADTLMFLCELYQVEDILTTFGYHNGNRQTITLTPTERKLVERFRELTDIQPAILKLLDLPEDHKTSYTTSTNDYCKKIAEDSSWKK